MLTYQGRDSWIAESLLEKRMWVDVNDYWALDACVKNDAVDVAKLLLDGGMDFDQYRQRYPNSVNLETIQTLEEHWNEIQPQAQEQEPEEYRVCVEAARGHFAEIDTAITVLQSNMEDGSSLDPTRVKAVFYTLYFGGEAPDIAKFLDCFVTYEERTRTVPVEGSDPPAEVEETYTVAVPVADMTTVYANITANLGTPIPDDLSANVDSVYSLVKNGYHPS